MQGVQARKIEKGPNESNDAWEIGIYKVTWKGGFAFGWVKGALIHRKLALFCYITERVQRLLVGAICGMQKQIKWCSTANGARIGELAEW